MLATKALKPAQSRASFRQRQAEQRIEQRRRVHQRVMVPLDPALQTYDPLTHPPSRHSLGRILVLLVGAVGVHAATLGLLAVIGAFVNDHRSAPLSPERLVINVQETPPPAPQIIEPPKKEEPKAPEPPPKAKKIEVKKPAEPPPPDPIDVPKTPPPPAEPVKTPPRRIVGLSLESTVVGGQGPSFATGNTRMGNTESRAADPTAVEKIDPAPVSANRVASRLPVAGVTYTTAKRLKAIQPEYPASLRQQGIEADVEVLLKLDAEGRVLQVTVVKGSKYPEFDGAAIAAAQQEKFAPATKNGEPVADEIKYTYRFRLSDL